MMIRRRKKPCPKRGEQDKIPVKEVNMKYEALKEILEKITQKPEKRNSETFISTLLAEVLNLIMKAEREVHVEKRGDSKKWLRPDPYFKASLQSPHLLFRHAFQFYEIKNEKNYI